MANKVPEKLSGRERLMFIRKCLVATRVKSGKLIFSQKAEDSINDPNVKKMPGMQNKYHGRKFGSYKHKRDIVRASRRKNRS